MKRYTERGFTLIELMIVVAISGILAAIAMPAYQNYMKKSKFSEVVLASQAAKIAVEICAQNIDGVVGCNSTSAGIPASAGTGSKYVNNVLVKDGVITVTPNVVEGFKNTDTYQITPAYTSGSPIVWNQTGGCLTSNPQPLC